MSFLFAFSLSPKILIMSYFMKKIFSFSGLLHASFKLVSKYFPAWVKPYVKLERLWLMVLNALPTAGPSINNVAKTTTVTNARSNAYSTRPCPNSLDAKSIIHLLQIIFISSARVPVPLKLYNDRNLISFGRVLGFLGINPNTAKWRQPSGHGCEI